MRKICVILGLVLLAGFAAAEAPLSTWQLPAVWPRHSQLREQLIAAIRRGDIPAMENICRMGIQTIPADPTWHYNLACALAYRAQPDAALDELDHAIDFGFRDANTIAKDTDLSRIAALPRFAELLKKARNLSGKPVPGRPAPAPLYVTAGSTATLSETNLVFNFDTGVYDALLALSTPSTPLAEQADKFLASQPNAKEIPYVRAWLSSGTAAGNIGDVYLNRDLGHSTLNAADFPFLTTLRYADAARAFKADINHPNASFSSAAVFGNISRGYLEGHLWRSMARATFTDPAQLATRMDLLYHSNQFWVLPCVNDVGKPELGDVFPANAPFQLVSLGASWSDLPFLGAALGASASFRPQIKKAILARKLMGPTLQWLIRRSQRGISTPEDYLSPKAHPTAFPINSLDTVALVERAHKLDLPDIPPAVSLAAVNSRLFPIQFPMAGRDYPDTVGELLFSTSSAISFILRAPAGERTFMFRATPFPAHTEGVTYTWRVVHGDPTSVRIAPPLGESVNNPENGLAQITIDRRHLTDRIDVACFAKAPGTDWGAPSIISFSAVALEQRTYRPDGQIESIDYTNPDYVYCDPAIALPRAWKDTYTYATDGTPLGFMRSVNGRASASFTPAGERILERTPSGAPKRVVRVKYIPRRTGNKIAPFELTFTDDGEPYDVKK